MRMHVKPADPMATIADPERGRDLTPEGHPVTWTPYWAGLKGRGDIIATPIPDQAADATSATEVPPPVGEPEQAQEPDPGA